MHSEKCASFKVDLLRYLKATMSSGYKLIQEILIQQSLGKW